MKYLLIFLFLLNVNTVFGQNTGTVSSIEIDFYKGYNSWGDTGIYTLGEIIKIKKINLHQFKIEQYLQIKRSVGSDKKTLKNDTLKCPKRNYGKHKISQRSIDSLVSQLNTYSDNFTIEYIKPQLRVPTTDAILSLAKKK